MTGASSPDVAAVLGDIISEADRRAVTGAYAEWLAQQRREWLAAGVWGGFDDDRAVFGEWGFDLREIGAPLTICMGRRTGSSRSPTASGWPSRPAPRPCCRRVKGTCRWRSAPTARSSTGCSG